MALVRALHQVFGVCEVGEQTVAAFPDDWTLVDPNTPLGHPPVEAAPVVVDDPGTPTEVDVPAEPPAAEPAETA